MYVESQEAVERVGRESAVNYRKNHRDVDVSAGCPYRRTADKWNIFNTGKTLYKSGSSGTAFRKYQYIFIQCKNDCNNSCKYNINNVNKHVQKRWYTSKQLNSNRLFLDTFQNIIVAPKRGWWLLFSY